MEAGSGDAVLWHGRIIVTSAANKECSDNERGKVQGRAEYAALFIAGN